VEYKSFIILILMIVITKSYSEDYYTGTALCIALIAKSIRMMQDYYIIVYKNQTNILFSLDLCSLR